MSELTGPSKIIRKYNYHEYHEKIAYYKKANVVT